MTEICHNGGVGALYGWGTCGSRSADFMHDLFHAPVILLQWGRLLTRCKTAQGQDRDSVHLQSLSCVCRKVHQFSCPYFWLWVMHMLYAGQGNLYNATDQVLHQKLLSVMGPTRPWVQSCWIEEIRELAEEKLQKLQRVNCILAGVTWIARVARSWISHRSVLGFSRLRFVIYYVY